MRVAFTAVMLGCSALIAIGAGAAEPTAAPAANPAATAANPAPPPPAPGAEAAPPAATAATNAPGTTTTGEVTVQQPSPQIQVQQPQPSVTVRQPQPEIIVRQPPPVITVQIPQPDIVVRMPKPQVSVATPPPRVSVSTSKPQVEVQAAKPQVNVAAQEQAANVQMQQARPVVRFEHTGRPKVTVTRQGEPKVTYEQAAANGEAANAEGNAQAANAGAAGGTANAEAAGQPGNGAASADGTFAEKAYQGGIAEVQMGQLAQQKAKSEDMKKFGQILAQDHMQANAKLQGIAQQQNLSLSAKPGPEAAEEGRKLQDLSGTKFDRAFIQQEIADHKKDIAEFQREAQSGSDPNIKAFAEQALPVLQKHLQMAESLMNQKANAR